MDTQMPKLRPNPEKGASVISSLLFCFIHPLLRLGYKKPLELGDLNDVMPDNEASHLTNLLKQLWNEELASAREASREPKLLRAVYMLVKKRFWGVGFLLFIEEIMRALQPYFMGHVIRFFRTGRSVSLGVTCVYAAGLSLCAFAYVLCHHRCFYRMQNIGMQLRVACSGLIYAKLLSLDSAALKEVTVGHVVNLISTDVSRCDQAVLFLHYFWASPVSLVALIIILYIEMSNSCFAGFGVLFVMIPIQMVVGRLMGQYRRKVAYKSDKRIGIMNEIVNAVRVIKMYAWEYPFMTLVTSARAQEVQKLRYHALCQAIVIGSYYVTGRLALLGALTAHVLTGQLITSEVVFVGAAMFNAARLTLSLYLPFAVQNIVELRVTMDRIQKFLLLPDRSEDKKATLLYDHPTSRPGIVSMQRVSAGWNKDGRSTISLISFDLSPGQLLAIVGPLGSGKSTILQTLLREVSHREGAMVVRGRIAYVPQEAWLFPGTIRQNVLFDNEMNEERYHRALVVSALDKDLVVLPQGDMTMVSDKGSCLSGGQKARINLARAVYQNADIYLLDDPLSAVDSAVGKAIFETCVLGYLKDKTRILVTHHLHYLKPADRILVLKQGRQIAYGPYDQLKTDDEHFIRILHETEMSYHNTHPGSESSTDDSPSNRDFDECDIFPDDEVHEDDAIPVVSFRSISPAGKSPEAQHLMEQPDKVSNGEVPMPPYSGKSFDFVDEYAGSKGVSCKTYWIYLRAIGHPCLIFLLLFMAVTVQVYFTSCDWWLRQWSNEVELNSLAAMYPQNISIVQEKKSKMTLYTGYTSAQHLRIWSVMISVLLLVSIAQAIVLRFALLMAAFRLHSRMFNHIIRTSVVFFDRNPIGRILNRFSKDTNVMDEMLAFVFFDFILGFLMLLSFVIVNSVINPWMFAVLAPLFCIFVFLRHYYMRTARALKRLEATVRSPLYSHFSSTVSGLSVIRAFRAEKKVTADFVRYQNIHSVTWSAFLAASRLFSVYVDCLSAVYVTLVAYVSILTSNDMAEQSGSVGLALFYASSLTGFLQFMLRQSTEVESMMVSVERIVDYGNLPEEASLTSSNPPNKDWPSEGQVIFDGVSLRYGPNEPYVLKNINFVIQPGQKIGLVGRTGAGKSSVITALFRLVEPEGRIIVDGVDISTIGLHELRKKISIIPQDPTLFLGSLRLNLDPFNECSDDEIWSALDQVRLKNDIAQLDEGLESCTDEGGQNFSIGQRQLICLARALLRKNKILILDEATANVDYSTDALIQRTIRSEFKHCSILTIAHRLNTVMDCHRILVMHDGRLVEDDVPAVLLAREDSMLSQFVAETGAENARLLRRMAERADLMRRRQSRLDKTEDKNLTKKNE